MLRPQVVRGIMNSRKGRVIFNRGLVLNEEEALLVLERRIIRQTLIRSRLLYHKII